MMRMKVVVGVVALALVLAATPARADLIYFTGSDLNNDGRDDYVTVNGVPAYLVTSIAGGWPLLPDATRTLGLYISWAADQSNLTQGGVLGQLYTYSFDFNWAGATTDTTFDFRWLSDDYLSDIKLNGVSLGVNNLGTASPWTTSYSANGVNGTVASGTNTLEFLIWNTGGNQPPYYLTSGPTGMAADFTVHGDATTVPEPGSTLLLLSGALLGLGAWRRRRQ